MSNPQASATTLNDGLSRLQAAIAAHGELGKLTAEELRTVYRTAQDLLGVTPKQSVAENGTYSLAHAQRVRDRVVEIDDLERAHQMLKQPKPEIPVRPSMVDELRKRASGQQTAAPSPSKSNWLQNTTAEAKVLGGIWLLSGALSLAWTCNAAKNIVAVNDNGERQIQWNNVSMALVNGLITAGCAYMGVSALKSGGARR